MKKKKDINKNKEIKILKNILVKKSENLSMTLIGLIEEILNGGNIRINGLNRFPREMLKEIYNQTIEEEIPEATLEIEKKSWELQADKKIEITKESTELAEKLGEAEKFFEFVKQYTGDFKNLLTDKLILNGTGRRGEFPKIDMKDMDNYMRFQTFIEKIRNSTQISERAILIESINSHQYSEVEEKILKARLEVIDEKKEQTK